MLALQPPAFSKTPTLSPMLSEIFFRVLVQMEASANDLDSYIYTGL